MEQADSCRRAASEAVADVEPPQLHELIETTLDEASMVPGVLTIESAAATIADGRSVLDSPGDPIPERDTGSKADPTREGDADEIATQAAGVQLIYEGLRLTRSLAHEEPWTDPETHRDDAETGDLEILAADILVARGFYLLARTDAAGKAVRTVQAFGRDQTHRAAVAADERRENDAAAADGTLERDILELAVLTGAAAVGDTPSRRLLAAAEKLGDDLEVPFPPAAECLDGLEPSLSDQLLEDHPTDRATSATDP